MPIYEFTAPDGKTYEVEVPEGVTEAQAFEALAPQLGAAPDPNWQDGLPAAGATPGGPSGPDPGLPPGAAAGTPEQAALDARRDMVSEMPWYEKLAAGAGQTVDSNIRGIRQLFNMATGDQEDLARLNAEEEDARVNDEALKESGWGKTGQIAGHLAQMAIPAGAVSKGVKALTMGMPRAVQAGSVLAAEGAIGAGYGAAQPTIEGESHADNAAIGAAFGAGSRLAPMAVGTGVRIAGEKTGVSPALRAATRALTAASGRPAQQGSASVRSAAGDRIGELTSGVRVPLKPLANQLTATERAYGSALPDSVRSQLTALSEWGKRYGGQMKGDKLQEMRTAVYREASEQGGAAQSGLEKVGRILDRAVDDQLTASQLRALRQARTEYRTGIGQPAVRFTAPATVAGGTGLFLSPGPQ